MTQDTDGSVDFTHDGHVAEITLNRPAKHNALTPQMYRQIGQCCAEAPGDHPRSQIVATSYTACAILSATTKKSIFLPLHVGAIDCTMVPPTKARKPVWANFSGVSCQSPATTQTR